MPDYDPPENYSGTPNRFLLPAGTMLWHIHPQSRKPTEFTPHHRRPRLGAGRFDGTDEEPFDAYNAGLEAATAVANVLLGGIPAPYTEFRTVRRVSVARQQVSVVATTTELSLVSLCDAIDLNAVGQDLWLIHSDECHDPRVRRWGRWIRANADWAEGFIWPPRGGPERRSVVLFGDRCDSAALEPDPLYEVNLDDEFGATWLNGVLVEYRARIMPPKVKK